MVHLWVYLLSDAFFFAGSPLGESRGSVVQSVKQPVTPNRKVQRQEVLTAGLACMTYRWEHTPTYAVGTLDSPS